MKKEIEKMFQGILNNKHHQRALYLRVEISHTLYVVLIGQVSAVLKVFLHCVNSLSLSLSLLFLPESQVVCYLFKVLFANLRSLLSASLPHISLSPDVAFHQAYLSQTE